MLDVSRFAVPELARQELREFLRMAELVGMDADRQRRSLRLSRDHWRQWLDILDDAPVIARQAKRAALAVGIHADQLGHAQELAQFLPRQIRHGES